MKNLILTLIAGLLLAASRGAETAAPGGAKLLFLGNSITLHGPAPDIGWTGNWGMAASAEEKDYAHLVMAEVARATGAQPRAMIRNIADFERGYETYDVGAKLKAELEFGADVVVVAIGENAAEPATDAAKGNFAAAFARLLAEIKRHGTPSIYVRSSFWPNATKDGIMKKASAEAGVAFVDIAAQGREEANAARSERKFAHNGVAAHPGDKGMRAIADAICAAMRERGDKRVGNAPARRRRALYNFDGDSCLATKANSKGPVPVDEEDVKRLIGEVAYEGSLVDTVLVCVNAQVMYYPTKVGTMRGALSTPEERAQWPASEKRRFENLKSFFDRGVDPYALMLAETRRRGREALLTFRMNDDHGNDFLRTRFLAEHPDWRLGTEQYRGKGAMDFGREEAREHTFRLIEEAVRRYDCDGIELDFNRFPMFFKDGAVEEKVAKMNALVERVRKMLDEVGRERGRRLTLAARPPSNYGRTPPTPETARQLGCDVAFWAKRGWVDFVAVSEFLHERGDLPMGLWKKAVPGVPVYGGIECAKAGAGRNLNADEYREASRNLVKAGADGIYLFNFFTSREGGENAQEPPFGALRDLATRGVSGSESLSPR